jgi:hypothetical protein
MKRYFIVSTIIITVIILMEIGLRLFYYEQLKSRETSTNRIPDSLKVFNREPNTEEAYITPGVKNRFRSNNLGYVGPDFSMKKKPGTYRIIVIGNSNVVGKQMNGDNNFCIVLQKIFHLNNMDVEVINCAREGGSKDIQNLHIIEDELINYQPNLILLENSGRLKYRRYVYEGYEDYTLDYDPLKPETRTECKKIVDKINKNRWLTRTYDMSFIIRAICKRYVDKHSNWDVKKLYSRNNKLEIYLYTYIKKDAKVYLPTYSVSWDYALTKINNIKSSLDSINSQLVLFTYGDYSDEEKGFFEDNMIDFIQLKMNYNYLPINSKLEGHTNEIGHALIAERLFNKIILKNYISKISQSND